MNILFCNLKVISQLKENQKLYVNDDHLVIDQGIYASPILRWWYREDREKTLGRIHDIVESAIHNGNQAISSCLRDEDNDYLENSKTNIELREWELERDRVTSMSNLAFLERLVSELEGMIQGIDILKKTYVEDVTICSKLEVEIQNISTNINKFKKFVEDAN